MYNVIIELSPEPNAFEMNSYVLSECGFVGSIADYAERILKRNGQHLERLTDALPLVQTDGYTVEFPVNYKCLYFGTRYFDFMEAVSALTRMTEQEFLQDYSDIWQHTKYIYNRDLGTYVYVPGDGYMTLDYFVRAYLTDGQRSKWYIGQMYSYHC